MYVLLHFEYKDETIIIVKLLYRGMSQRRVALLSLIVIVTSFLYSRCNVDIDGIVVL